MKLIIEISEQIYKQSCVMADVDGSPMFKAIKNGTPLSESDDCVSRQAVLEQTYEWSKDEFLRVTNPLDYLRKRINSLPPVTSAEKVGQWIKSEIPSEEYVCSECGGACWYYDVEKGVTKSRFCPNCGAKMQEVTE